MELATAGAAVAAGNGAAATILSLVAADGTATVAYARSLARADALTRDLADAVHALSALHGSVPGVIDRARAGTSPEDPAAEWLEEAAVAFAGERGLLSRLAAALGPRPSTPGQAASEGPATAQRRALDVLARSDRSGCALGACLAFVLDWSAIRPVLDASAARTGLVAGEGLASAANATQALVDRITRSPATARAMAFGAQQLLAQHRGLWHLLEARASARTDR